MLTHSEVMRCTGVKRKMEDALVEQDGSLMWSNNGNVQPGHMHYPGQRQCVLNMSVCKLHKTPQRRIEPSLRRSVLIFNTLRYIENELKMEGINVTQSAMSDGLVPALDTATHELNLDPLPTTLDHPMCPPQRTNRTTSPVALGDYNSCQSSTGDMVALDYQQCVEPPLDVPMETCGISVSPCSMMSVLNSAPVLSVTPQHMPLTACCSPVTHIPTHTPTEHTSITTFDLDSASITTTTTSVAVSTNTPGEPVHPPPSDIFADIDVSRYDFDFLSPFSMNSSSSVASNKMLPLNCDDLVHSFANASATLVNSEQFTNSAFTALRTERPSTFRNDLLGDDLDHIMQVLVGI